MAIRHHPPAADVAPSGALVQVADDRTLVRDFLTDGLSTDGSHDRREFLAADHVLHGPAPYQTLVGADACRDYVAGLHRAVPDLAVSVAGTMAGGDRVLAFGTMTGRHEGDLVLGETTFEPTGRRFSVSITATCTVADGRIVETDLRIGRADLLRQLGLAF